LLSSTGCYVELQCWCVACEFSDSSESFTSTRKAFLRSEGCSERQGIVRPGHNRPHLQGPLVTKADVIRGLVRITSILVEAASLIRSRVRVTPGRVRRATNLFYPFAIASTAIHGHEVRLIQSTPYLDQDRGSHL